MIIPNVLTPALLIFPDIVENNIRAAVRMMHGDPERWRPHIKTVKCAEVIRLLLAHGVRAVKCSTTLELSMCCEAGVPDILFAMPVVATTARRVAEIASHFPGTRVSTLVEAESQMPENLEVFVDVNPGMNRTGILESRVEEIRALARKAGDRFRGLHFYDGHLGSGTLQEREVRSQEGYGRLLGIIGSLGMPVGEVITSGTPAAPGALCFEGFRNPTFQHRVSPGTIVFNDLSSLEQLPGFGFAAAALVAASVMSHPAPGIVTCDAGHKSVSADAGVPTCAVVGRPELTPLKPSEEHLPIQVAEGARAPEIGEVLHLLPRHICPTVNLFDRAHLVRNGQLDGYWEINARGHEAI